MTACESARWPLCMLLQSAAAPPPPPPPPVPALASVQLSCILLNPSRSRARGTCCKVRHSKRPRALQGPGCVLAHHRLRRRLPRTRACPSLRLPHPSRALPRASRLPRPPPTTLSFDFVPAGCGLCFRTLYRCGPGPLTPSAPNQHPSPTPACSACLLTRKQAPERRRPRARPRWHAPYMHTVFPAALPYWSRARPSAGPAFVPSAVPFTRAVGSAKGFRGSGASRNGPGTRWGSEEGQPTQGCPHQMLARGR